MENKLSFYIAARFDNKEGVKRVYDKLMAKGHEVHTDWTVHEPFYPYHSDPDKCAKYSDEDIKGAMGCDVFVLLADESHNGREKAPSHGRGMFIELGAAMSSFLLRGAPRVFIIGPDNDKAIFHFHNCVKRFNTIDEVLEELENSYSETNK